MSCDNRLIPAKKQRHLFLRQPHRFVFKTDVQPDGLVRLVDDNLVLSAFHSYFPVAVVQQFAKIVQGFRSIPLSSLGWKCGILYQSGRFCVKREKLA